MQPEEMPANITSDRFADQGFQPIDPATYDVLNELIKREPIFHRLDIGTTRQDFENMTIAKRCLNRSRHFGRWVLLVGVIVENMSWTR
jgi:hypothetical protein